MGILDTLKNVGVKSGLLEHDPDEEPENQEGKRFPPPPAKSVAPAPPPSPPSASPWLASVPSGPPGPFQGPPTSFAGSFPGPSPFSGPSSGFGASIPDAPSIPQLDPKVHEELLRQVRNTVAAVPDSALAAFLELDASFLQEGGEADGQKRARLALAALKRQKVSSEQVVREAREALFRLEQLQSSLDPALAQEEQKLASWREKSEQGLRGEIASISRQIETLQAQIASLEGARAEKESGIASLQGAHDEKVQGLRQKSVHLRRLAETEAVSLRALVDIVASTPSSPGSGKAG